MVLYDFFGAEEKPQRLRCLFFSPSSSSHPLMKWLNNRLIGSAKYRAFETLIFPNNLTKSILGFFHLFEDLRPKTWLSHFSRFGIIWRRTMVIRDRGNHRLIKSQNDWNIKHVDFSRILGFLSPYQFLNWGHEKIYSLLWWRESGLNFAQSSKFVDVMSNKQVLNETDWFIFTALEPILQKYNYLWTVWFFTWCCSDALFEMYL